MINCVLLNKSNYEIVYDKNISKGKDFMSGNDFNQNFFSSTSFKINFML